jgi:hypothetical protein
VLSVGDTALRVLLDARPVARRFQCPGAAARGLAFDEPDRELEPGHAKSFLRHDHVQLVRVSRNVLRGKAGDVEDRRVA